MSGYLQLTTAQKVRSFLDALQMTASPTASGREIEALLNSRVRARRDDPEARRRLRELLLDLARADADRLPAPQCETRDASALAGELEALLVGCAAVGPAAKPRPTAALFAAALLLCGAAAAASCGPDNDAKSTSCAGDLSNRHFAAFVAQASDLTQSQVAEAETEYAAMDQSEQRDVMKNLCGMSSDEIAAYIKANFPAPNPDDDNDASPDDDNDDNNDNNDNDNNDNDVAYKGVSF